MSSFNLDQFIQQLRDVATQPEASDQVKSIMKQAFQNPEAVKQAMSGYEGGEEILFEDETVSIWYCRFDPDIHVPPHNHKTQATIGVYDGEELNHFYLPKDGRLEQKTTRSLKPGDVLSMGPDAIHSVESANSKATYGIHVYLAALSTISRSLYDWDSGEALPMEDELFNRMQRVSAIN